MRARSASTALRLATIDGDAAPGARPKGLRLLAEMRAAGVDLDYAPDETIKDYIVSRRYENPALRPRNRTRRERYDDWMREKE